MTPSSFPALVLLFGCYIVGCGIGASASGTRYGLGFTPSRAKTIHGLAIGPANSAFLYDSARHKIEQTVNGVSIELIGAGILVPLVPYVPSGRDSVYARVQRMADSAYP